jgi:Autographiviridae portal protein
VADTYSGTYDAPSGAGSGSVQDYPHVEGPYALGEPASACYDRLAKDREGVLTTARQMSELTIPSLVPPPGYKAGDKLPGNNQSLGARCVNTLAASLLFIAFPPNQPVVRFEAVEYEVQQEIDKDPELWAQLEVSLARLAESHRKRLVSETTMESAYGVAMKLLIVAGNCLWKHISLNSPTVFNPCHYVCMRNARGDPLLSIHKECVSLQALAPDFRELVYAKSPELRDKPLWEQEVDIYSVCRLRQEEDEGYWEYWQEYKGALLPGTEVATDFDNPPMYPLWMIPQWGQNWGRSYCEEYRGDLFTAEALSSAVNDGAALMALSLLFVDPSGRTSVRQIREARNLSTFSGKATDLSVFRAEKGADLAFVMKVMETVDRRLSAAFLLNFAIQREGERVTAEEIRRLGGELDKALGGLYSELSQRTQRPIMMRFIHLNEEKNPKLPKLPKGLVQVQVITGVDALGNSKEVQDLDELASAVSKYFPKDAAMILKARGWVLRYAAAKGIKPDGLIATTEEIAAQGQADQQAAMRQTLLDKATGPAVSGVMDGLAQNGMPQLPQTGA